MKVLLHILGWSLGVLLVLQFLRIDVPPPPPATPKDEIKAPPKIMAILRRSCYDCHSNNTNWPWYSKIVPASWQVNSNVKNGRKWLNFSIWNQYPKERQQKLYKQIAEAVKFKMPPVEYLLIHKDARLTPSERKMLQDWALSQIKDKNSN